MLRQALLCVLVVAGSNVSQAETVVVCNSDVHIRLILKNSIENPETVYPEVYRTFAFKACGKMPLDGITIKPYEVIRSGDREFQIFKLILEGRPIFILRQKHRALPRPKGPTAIV